MLFCLECVCPSRSLHEPRHDNALSYLRACVLCTCVYVCTFVCARAGRSCTQSYFNASELERFRTEFDRWSNFQAKVQVSYVPQMLENLGTQLQRLSFLFFQ